MSSTAALRRARRLSGAAGGTMARLRAPKRLVYWRPKFGPGNFGDELSPIIVRYMLERRRFAFRARPSHRLLALGSVLHFARDHDVIWGTGVNWKEPVVSHQFRSLDVRAVRGPMTRDFLLDRGIACPEIYGDPGLLVAKILPARETSRRHEYVIIPNLNDMPLFAGQTNVISPQAPVREVLRAISSADLVIASSLHGIVSADSYGVPARLLLPRGHAENIGKYKEYYLGTDRSDVTVAQTLHEALEMGGAPVPNFDTAALEAAFPWDLYAPNV